MRLTISSGVMSVIHVDNPSNREEADNLQADREFEHAQAHGVAHERLHLFRIHQIQSATEYHRQAAEDPARPPSLRGEHFQLPADAEAIAHHVGEVVEHFGEIAAGFAMGEDGRAERSEEHTYD